MIDKEDQETIDRLDMLVHEYALVDDKYCTETAKELKKLIIHKIFEWDTLLYKKYE